MTARLPLFEQEPKVTKIVAEKTRIVGDFYWSYADILRAIGINESMYDQRIMAFMAIKLLIDNKKLAFNFDYKNSFGLSKKEFLKIKGKDTKESFLNIIKNIKDYGENLNFFVQPKGLNPENEDENILHYLNHKKTFHIEHYIEELPNEYLEMVLEIYTKKADFTNYPKEDYKDLYEKTISRMKKLSGDLTGQHFTQKSIIHLMCESALKDLAKAKSKQLAIYDPTCGTGSMLMESYYYFKNHIKKPISVYGQEYHGQTWLLAKIFLEISNIPNSIAYGNTLVDPAFKKINGNDSFDFIIANPPFGVDWKHDYEKVVKNMQSNEPNFFVVKDEKEKVVTPKKSDGQFLFILHILKLLQKSKEDGKNAKAVVISSSTLSGTGNERSSESKIRRAIFKEKFLETLLEQPNAMFTNTDISSHIWFFNNKKRTFKAQIIKANTEELDLFTNHPNPKDKMKNSYSQENIHELINLFKKEEEFISKTIDLKDMHGINIQNLLGKREIIDNTKIEDLVKEIQETKEQFCNMKSFLYGF